MELDINLIRRKLVHIQIKPTYTNINNVTMLIKNLDSEFCFKIPENPFLINRETIAHFCEEVEKIIANKNNVVISSKKKNNIKEIFMFPESALLPNNVYVSEKDNDEIIQDNFIEQDLESITSSENDISEKEEIVEEGYEYYSEDSGAEFSD